MTERNDNLQSDEVARLRRSVAELSVLNDLAQAIGATFEHGRVMNTVIRKAAAAVAAGQATITPVGGEDHTIESTIVRNQLDETDPHFHLHQSLVGLMLRERRPLIFNDPAGDERLKRTPLQEGIRNLVCAPLLVGDQLSGVLTAYNRRDGEDFVAQDAQLLGIIAIQSAQVLERARLLEDEEKAREMRRELEIAGTIQSSLLPEAPPALDGYDVAGCSVPAAQVGGDYFDYLPTEDGRWGFAVGDVSGKGVPAALLMANLQATLRSQQLLGESCRTCIERSNRLMFRNTRSEKFATLFHCCLTPETGALDYCNAGHEHPIIMATDGTHRQLGAGGIPLGMFEEFGYTGGADALAPGDCLVIYSDGVPDMEDPTEHEFGLERLLALLREVRDLPAHEIVVRIRDAVQAHADGAAPLDDVTVVVVKRVNGPI